MDALQTLRHEIRARGFLSRPTGRVLAELALHAALAAGGIALCATAATSAAGIARYALGLALVTLGSMGIGTNCHSASHHATSRSRWLDAALTYFGFSCFLGVSTTWWRARHLAEHHPAPNVRGVDRDIDFRGWLHYTDRDPATRGPVAWAPRRLRRAAVVVILLLFLPALQNSGVLHLSRHLADGRRRRRAHLLDLAAFATGLALWFALPLAWFSAPGVLVFHALRIPLLSLALFAAFGPAHLHADAAVLDASLGAGPGASDPVLIYTATTIDFVTGPIGRLLCAGLDYHIEHHIFPELSYVHYPALQPLVEAYCRERGYPYRRLGWRTALWRSIGALADGKPVIERPEQLAELARPAAQASVLFRNGSTAA
jgi:linoleoyl-CoA desaturase